MLQTKQRFGMVGNAPQDTGWGVEELMEEIQKGLKDYTVRSFLATRFLLASLLTQ